MKFAIEEEHKGIWERCSVEFDTWNAAAELINQIEAVFGPRNKHRIVRTDKETAA